MFVFYSTQQSDSNQSYYRGVLFEELLREYLRRKGYEVELRRKSNSLEYDITGRHTLDGRLVVGEAKAHQETISAATFNSFVGKAVTFLWDASTSGIFLSTSALSPEAEDHLGKLREATTLRVIAETGQDLELSIRATLGMPSLLELSRLAAPLIPVVTAQGLLQTDRGTFLLVQGTEAGGVFADRFALFRPDGAVVSDAPFLELLRSAVPDLQALAAVATAASPTPAASSRVLRKSPHPR